jgi:hypothetical protein
LTRAVKSEVGHSIECTMADPPVTVPGVENDVAVQQARRNTSRLVIEDLRAGGNCCEVRGRDGAEGTGAARV